MEVYLNIKALILNGIHVLRLLINHENKSYFNVIQKTKPTLKKTDINV